MSGCERGLTWNVAMRRGYFGGAEVEALGLKKDSELIVACGGVGTMKPSTNFPLGKESR